MRIIEIVSRNGGHRNQTINGKISNIPEGWAVIPDTLETENFPFGEVTAEEVDGVMTVTGWTPGTIPESEPEVAAEETATRFDRIEAQVTYTAMMTDTLLEG